MLNTGTKSANNAGSGLTFICLGAGEEESRLRALTIIEYMNRHQIQPTDVRIVCSGAYSALVEVPPQAREYTIMSQVFLEEYFFPAESVFEEMRSLTTAQNLVYCKEDGHITIDRRMIICCSPEQRIIVTKLFKLWQLPLPKFIDGTPYGFTSRFKYWAVTAGARSEAEVLGRETKLINAYRHFKGYGAA